MICLCDLIGLNEEIFLKIIKTKLLHSLCCEAMSKYSCKFVNDNSDLYNEIKQRLAQTKSPRLDEKPSFLSPLNVDVPGPGHYSVSETLSPLSAIQSIKFAKAKRFPDESLASERQPTLSNASNNHLIGFDTSVSYSQANSLRTLEATEKNSRIRYITARAQNKAQFCSFSKARRVIDLNLGECNEVGPGAYDVSITSQTDRPGFSFGSKWNSLFRGSISPGPLAYRPEASDIRANHKTVRGPVMAKPREKSPELREPLNKPPLDENHHKSSNGGSSSPKQSRPKIKFMGTGPKIALLPKETLDYPGPGAYEISSSFTDRERQDHKNSKLYPSFGKPSQSLKWFKEELPGPAEYYPSPIDNHKGKIKIGTSKRPGFFDPKKQVEVILNEEKLKRLRRLENLEKAKAEREKLLKVARPARPLKSRKLYFDELVEKSDSGPGFSYDVEKYKKFGSNISGGKIGKSERRFMKEIEEAKNTPGPGKYDIAKEEAMKPVADIKFSTSKRQDIFVKKDSYNIPGVGNYDVNNVSWSAKGGIMGQSKKGLTEEKIEKVEKPETFYQFIEQLDQKLEEIVTRENNRIQNSPW